MKDGKGDTTTFQYDVRDRILRSTFQDTQTVTSTYKANGLEATRTDSGGGATTYTYDHQGRLTGQTGPRSGVTQTMTYDKVGNLLTYADSGGTSTYTYDAANQLVRLREPGGTCPSGGDPAANSGCILFEYNQNARETKRVFPGGANVVTVRDNSGRPTRITAKTGTGTTAVDIGYGYAPASGSGDRMNVQTRTSFAEQGVAAGAATRYTYDSRSRVTKAEERSGSTITASWSYAYDGNSNRTSQTRSGSTGAAAGTLTYGYNAANQLTSATGQTTTWTYDAAGNQTRNGLTGVTSTYSDRHEVTAIGGTANTYFGAGNFDRLSSGSATFNSSAFGLMQRISGSTTHNYTRAPSGAAVGLRASSKSYYVQDHLGSVVGIFSSTGTYSGGYAYSPYGEARFTSTNSAVTANNLRYIGGYDNGGGVYKLGARYYDTAQGRFTQLDPSGQEKNPYGYAACNPVNGADPTGMVLGLTCPWGAVAGTVIVAAGVVELVGDAVGSAVAAAPIFGASVAAGAAVASAIAAQVAFGTWVAGTGVGECLE